MTKQEKLENLLKGYVQSYDITRPYEIGGKSFDAYAFLDVTNSQYVISKKVEMWRALCYEHVFFSVCDELTVERIGEFASLLDETMEPELVRRGEKYPPKDHMYTFLTLVLICDEVGAEARDAVKKFKYGKNYLFRFRGYCEAKILVFQQNGEEIFGNASARDLVKGYKKRNRKRRVRK